MITLDTTTIETLGDEIYSVERGSKVIVKTNGKALDNVVYANITKGVAICLKRDLLGNLVVSQGSVVHELVFGDLTAEPLG